uniref:Netrin-1 n=1 Tax=Sphaeramia orbicularis TaxID=375764 RepID=A0A673ABM0_9TELE
ECVDRACSPPIGNLASGRTLFTLSGCCGNTSLHHNLCPCPAAASHTCSEDPHPPAHMTDDPFLHPDTWWSSGACTIMQQDEIQLDLETQFCLSHVVLLFRSPRPAAMAIERSADFGKTWEVLKLFAHNCSMEFGLPDDFNQPGSLCTSRYTSAAPCSGGETYTSATESPASAPYAVYTLLARGTCLCHGHAEHCVPYNSSQDTCVFQVSARCVCTHHTAGDHCEKCAPLYNDRPWRPANGSSGEPNPCQKCECHGHADSCHFSHRAWLSSNGTSGGVCDNCQHNTAGRRCQRCRHGYRPSICHPSVCSDNTQICICLWFSEGGSWCHPRTGQCHCRAGVGGTSCSHCLPGYWGFGEQGCRACSCPHSCDPTTGQCQDRLAPGELHFSCIFLTMTLWLSIHVCRKCSCKEKRLRSVSDLCKTKHDYVIKASVLSAHDKGSHAEVQVKVRKVLKSVQVVLDLGTISIYPLSWTSRGCTCPILNPGMEYLLAGPEEAGTGRLLVTMQSVVVPWTPRLGLLISDALRNGCP